jgi:hypothetical protein
MKKFILSLSVLAIFAVTVNAQTFVRLKQAATADTIIKSQKLFTSMVNLNTNDLQAVTIGVKVDSVSGTPDVKFFLQRSNDGINWLNVVGDTITYSAVTTGGNPLIKGGSKYAQISINPFYGTFARVGYYTGSGTQKSKVWISLKSSTIR